MPLYTDEELKALPEYADLDDAVRRADEVIRFRICEFEKPDCLDQLANLSRLQSLVLALTDISAVLPVLAELKDLQVLYIQACQLDEFPRGILELSRLRILSIGNCGLRDLPVEIARLERLEGLGLVQNALTSLPETIGDLRALKDLRLSHNQIEGLPHSIGRLSCLKNLFLDSNRLEKLPDALGGWASLRRLSLRFNKLRRLPDALANVSALERIHLEHNPFEELPGWLSKLTVTIEAKKRSLYMAGSYKPSDQAPRCSVAELELYLTPARESYYRLLEEIQLADLGSDETKIVALARQAVTIESAEADDYSRAGNSRLGGFPDLPDESHFPKTDGLYWSFLAQINLAEVAPLNQYLPRSGLLSFFIDSTESCKGKVLYFPGGGDTLATVRHGGLGEMFEAQDDYTGNPHRVAFSKSLALPHELPDGFADPAYEAYQTWRLEHEDGEHQINGYTFTQLESPEEQAAANLGGQPEEWMPLLRLGWDASVGFCFWDAGTLTFSIHREDLRREDFSRVHLTLESS